jgi:hypothetical protein
MSGGNPNSDRVAPIALALWQKCKSPTGTNFPAAACDAKHLSSMVEPNDHPQWVMTFFVLAPVISAQINTVMMKKFLSSRLLAVKGARPLHMECVHGDERQAIRQTSDGVVRNARL